MAEEAKDAFSTSYRIARTGDFYSTLVANCFFNVFLLFTALVLNIITIQALRKISSFPKPLKTLLLSLAVSDLGVGLLVHPLYIVHLVMTIEQDSNNRIFIMVYKSCDLKVTNESTRCYLYTQRIVPKFCVYLF